MLLKHSDLMFEPSAMVMVWEGQNLIQNTIEQVVVLTNYNDTTGIILP